MREGISVVYERKWIKFPGFLIHLFRYNDREMQAVLPDW